MGLAGPVETTLLRRRGRIAREAVAPREDRFHPSRAPRNLQATPSAAPPAREKTWSEVSLARMSAHALCAEAQERVACAVAQATTLARAVVQAQPVVINAQPGSSSSFVPN